MSDYAVIVQNDESKWDDIKGDLYNYPSTYKSILTPGCRVVYYKGNMKNAAFASHRLSRGAPLVQAPGRRCYEPSIRLTPVSAFRLIFKPETDAGIIVLGRTRSILRHYR